jgi:hypothetical protein
MKKLFFSLVLGALCLCLWAQDGTLVYDTVVSKTRFSYSWGLRYSYEFFNVDATLIKYGTFPPERQPVDGKAKVHGVSAVFQAEWKYFILDLAPGMYWGSVSGGGRKWDDYGGSIQALGKFPLTDFVGPRDSKVHLSFLLGPEVMIRDGVGPYINGGVDLGFKATPHHILFMEGLYGMSVGGPAGEGSRYDNSESYHQSDSHKFQVTIGIKTLIMEDVFYLDGKEVGRRRR